MIKQIYCDMCKKNYTFDLLLDFSVAPHLTSSSLTSFTIENFPLKNDLTTLSSPSLSSSSSTVLHSNSSTELFSQDSNSDPSSRIVQLRPVGLNNGIYTFTILHTDHTLVLDVNAHGLILSKTFITRINSEIEIYLSAVTRKILEHIVRHPETRISFLYVSRNKRMVSLLLTLFQQLMLNIPPGVDALLSVQQDHIFLEYGNFIAYVGEYHDRINSFVGDHTILIHDFDAESADQLLDNLTHIKSLNIISNFAVFFDANFISTPKGKQILADLFTNFAYIHVFDITDATRAAISLINLVNTLL